MEPLSKRLGLRPNTAALLLGVPAGLAAILDTPEGVSVSHRTGGRFGFVLAFSTRGGELVKTVRAALDSATKNAIVWVAHPRDSVAVASDFGAVDFIALLQEHRRMLGTSIRLGSQWVALRLKHY